MALFDILNVNPAQNVQPYSVDPTLSQQGLLGMFAQLGQVGARGIAQAAGRDLRSTQQRVSQASSGLDPQNPQSLRQVAVRLNEIGETARAAALVSMADELEQKQQAAQVQKTGLQSLSESLAGIGQTELSNLVLTGQPEYVRAGIEALQQSKETQERRIITDVNGRQRYVDTGDLVFPGVQQSPDGESGVRAQRIADYIENFDMSREEAIKAVDTEVRIDPITGNLISRDPVTGRGQIVPIDLDQSTNPPFVSEFGLTESDIGFDVEKGVGVASGVLAAYNSTIGQLPFLPVYEDTPEARQKITILGNDIIQALGTSSRPPVIEQDRLISLLPQISIAENPRIAQGKVIQIVELLTQQLIDDKRYSSDASNNAQLRNTSSERAQAIQRMLGRLLTPDAATNLMATVNQVNEYTNYYGGMSREQLEQNANEVLDPNASRIQREIFIQMYQRQLGRE